MKDRNNENCQNQVVSVEQPSHADGHTDIVVFENEELLFSILNFCDVSSRSNLIFLSTKQLHLLTSDASFKWRVERLHVEKGIYHSLVLPRNTTWKDIYLSNLKRKDLWEKQNELAKNENNESIPLQDDTSFHIQVSARFRPKMTIGNKMNQYHDDKKYALPLYQRLALIQMNQNLKTKKEAFKVLYEQGGLFGKYQEMQDRYTSDETRDDEKDNATNEEDDPKHSPSLRGGVHLIDEKSNFAILVDPTKGLRKFDFDNVFHQYVSQESVYTATSMPLIAEFINGFNVSCIVYGQTGSGKTHTMYGESLFEHSRGINGQNIVPETWGVVPRSCNEIFEAVEYRKKSLNLKFDAEIAISYIEIFGDSVTDLLREGRSCGQSKVAAQRYVLDGSSEVKVTSMSDTLALLNQGESHKRKAATAMNQRSSRAHSVFIITMKQICVNSGVSRTNRLFLADLGGSEQSKKSQPVTSDQEQSKFERKQRAREAVNINLGLLALKQCVEALRKKSNFVPYTDSKLTMMLSSGLGGDSKTAVIVCGAQEQRHGLETIAAMKFGHVCKGISNSVTTSTNMLQDLLQNINTQIEECQENIKLNETWETKEVKRYDEHGKVIEIRNVSVVTGAETYRKKLSTLIQQKMSLTGDTTDLYNEKTSVEGFGNAHLYDLGNKVIRL